MYASFNGDFRRRPEQNLSGASNKLSRHEIIERAHQERLKREEQRLRLRSALCIQSHVRSYFVRQRAKQLEREKFEILQKEYKSDLYINPIFSRFIFFYNEKVDYDKLIWLAQKLLKLRNSMLEFVQNDFVWRHRISFVLTSCVNALNIKKNNAILLRILDEYIRIENVSDERAISLLKISVQLVKRDYFKKLRKFLDESSSIESNPTLSVEIVNFIIRPIQALTKANATHYGESMFKPFCDSLLSQEFTVQIKEVLLPRLANNWFPSSQFYTFFVNNYNNLNQSVYLFYSVLILTPDLSKLNPIILPQYFHTLSILSKNIYKKSKFEMLRSLEDDIDEDDDDDDIDMSFDTRFSGGGSGEIYTLSECISLLNAETLVQGIVNGIESSNEASLLYLTEICFSLLAGEDLAVQKHKLLYMLAFRPQFLQAAWNLTDRKNLLNSLLRGAYPSTSPPNATKTLTVFCELFNLLLTTLHDDEFWEADSVGEMSTKSSMPFSLAEVVEIATYLKHLSVCLLDLTISSPKMTTHSCNNFTEHMKYWIVFYKSCIKLINNLYQKDSRLQFTKENFWSKNINLNFPTDAHKMELVAQIFSNTEERPLLTVNETRWLRVLRDIPFLVSLESRVALFRALISRLHRAHQDPERSLFLLGPAVSVTVRRSHLYEDAFLKLHDADLRQKLRVQFINAAGLEEAGIDGGGILREFLSELLTTCFDPNRGYFKLNRANLLYPNPAVHRVDPEFAKHYIFIGKMLGKALYENILVELPLAEFFLTKLVSRKFDVDFHYLASLDQVVYKNMLFLKNYQGNFQELGLDFTVVNEELGETRVEELKPGGAGVAVTSSNRIEYIHLLADYKMNKQIRQQCLAFKKGLHSVLDLSYLQIFSNKELQLIISGADYEIDVQDLKQHTNYSGERTSDHPVIKSFWEILESFTNVQKRQLLKFVTSCSRPPLLGFKELQPSFCIQLSDAADRLPSASTCMNLLKIPAISDPDILKERLLYAISQGAGFELS